MSHLHFVATEAYRKRVIQLGEQPERVFNVGALGIENINRLELMDKGNFEASIQFRLRNLSTLVTFHPVTLERETAGDQFKELLSALEQNDQLNIIFTKPNADTDGRIIISLIDEFVNKHPERSCSFVSLGQLRFLSALKHVDFVIGNSSSGLLEAPSFGIPTINIGERQRGRIMGDSVVQCDPVSSSIGSAIHKALEPSFKEKCRNSVNPYGTGNASEKIIDILKNFPLENILKKKFFDIG
jgi:GDP/UDP-N,N'-diacetylbacillosamine 2-epimerase (hydrolysing)